MKIKTAEQYNKLQANRNCLAGTSNKKAAGSKRNKKHKFTTHNNYGSLRRAILCEYEREVLKCNVVDPTYKSKPNHQARAVSMSDCFPEPVWRTGTAIHEALEELNKGVE